MPIHQAKSRVSPTTSTVPLVPKKSTPKLLAHNGFSKPETPDRLRKAHYAQ